MWNLFYRNTRLLILTICLILVWGLFSLQALPRMEDPQPSLWVSQITTQFPGASAERVESLVTEKIEQELLEVEGIKYITSTSRLGSSAITVELQETVRNINEVWSRVRDRLGDITLELPPGVSAPQYEELHIKSDTLIVALTWELETPSNPAILRRLSEQLKTQLYALGSIEEIEFWGAPSEEILVEINQADLAVLGLTPQQVSQQIRLSDAKVSSGQLRNSNNDLLIEVETELDSLERIRQIPIRVGSNSEQLVPLGDIATVTKGIQEPPREIAIINGQTGIALAVRIESRQRIDQWMKRAHQTLEEFRRSKPPGIGLHLLLDQNQYVETRLNRLFQNLWLGTLLVVACTALLMGGKSALVVGVSLPLSVLIVFGGMNVLEVPLDNSSVTGLIIALGMLIDNAIVVVDEMEHLLKKGFSPLRAIPKTASYLAIPLLASTLTTVLTFAPMLLTPGGTGEFVRSLALSVILALLSSLLLSLTVIPALNGWMSPRTTKPSRRRVSQNQVLENRPLASLKRFWSRGFSLGKLTKVYRQTLVAILMRPALGILLALVLPVTGFLMVGNVPQQFFPTTERDQLYIELELSSSASLEQTKSVVEEATEVIRQHPEIANIYWFLGTHAPAFHYSMLSTGIKGGISNYASAAVQTTSATESLQVIRSLQQELDLAFPAAKILVKQLESGPPVPPIELRLYGPSLDTLRELGSQVRAELVQVANVTHTSTSLGADLTKLALSLDEETARLTGLDNTQIAQQLDANLEGNLGGSILEENEELPLRVRLDQSDRGNFNQIATLDLLPNNPSSPEPSSPIPLSALGKLTLVPETATITRRNARRVNTIQGSVTAGTLPSTVLADFKERLLNSDFQIPPGYELEFGGEAEESSRSVTNLMAWVVPVLVLMLATLVLSFNSFRCAAIVYLVAIGSVGLALASLWFFGYPLGFMAICGIVGLIGVAINDSIVVLAALRAHPQARYGERKAMVEVIVRSTRHVLTTTITTIAGFIPLFLDGGTYSPLAICVAGGVGGATLLALFFVPCAYLLLTGRNNLPSLKLFAQQKSSQLSKVMRDLVKAKN
ncbi:MAG: efflux RND transporter permease subunit [Pleurocapsa sp. MO_226.B13]|nr:efflux RND transporter permease subunit [Pleurocapsa sp. MO_226.B13]